MNRVTLILTLGTLLVGAGQAQTVTGQAATGQTGMKHMQTPPAVAPKALPASPSVRALKLTQGWVSAAPPGAEELSAYLVLGNPGRAAVTLIGVSSPVSGQATLMTTTKDAAGRGSMTMASAMNIAAGGSLRVLPGQAHVMLRSLKRQPQPGEQVALTLRFADGSARTFSVPVKKW